MAPSGEQPVREAAADDLPAVARLLDAFNREFGDPTPGPDVLAERLARLVAAGDTLVLVTGDGPDGLALLRFRAALWSGGAEAYLAELYVVPDRRGHGMGRALLVAAMAAARARGADTMDLGTEETDVVARHLYERLGFTNREGGGSGPLMYVYERDL